MAGFNRSSIMHKLGALCLGATLALATAGTTARARGTL